MKRSVVILLGAFYFLSCNSGEPVPGKLIEEPEKFSFFPVTDFIKGQIAEIRSAGVNPVKTSIIKGKKDSGWIKVENFNAEFAAFLSPVIDSVSMVGKFSEKKFLDQTIDAFTFTYDPVTVLPDSFSLQHVDVYIDPETNTVRRVYMVKKTPDHKTLQLTWQTNRSCRIVSIASDPNGKDYVEKEVEIKWDF